MKSESRSITFGGGDSHVSVNLRENFELRLVVDLSRFVSLLLGDEYAAKVRSEAAVFGEGSIFMLAGRRTVDVQMKLWKLQGFLADYKSMK